MLAIMGDMGIEPEKHHHEVAASQHELGIKFTMLTRCGDNMQIYKYVIHRSRIYGKTATFMPKPIYGDNGSGMHVHQSIWKDGKPLFAGIGYADLRTCASITWRHHQTCQGAQRLHQPVDQFLQAAYPGFEARLLAYSARDRSASCRIPFGRPEGQARRSALPRSGRNPYLAYAAMLMAASTASRTRSIRATRWTRISTRCRRKS